MLAKLAEYTDPTTPANANDDNFTKNQQLVLDNEAIFMPNGTWIVGEMAGSCPAPTALSGASRPCPLMEEGGDRYSYTFFEQCLDSGRQPSIKDLAKAVHAPTCTATRPPRSLPTAGSTPAVQPITGMTDKLAGDNKVLLQRV